MRRVGRMSPASSGDRSSRVPTTTTHSCRLSLPSKLYPLLFSRDTVVERVSESRDAKRYTHDPTHWGPRFLTARSDVHSKSFSLHRAQRSGG